MKKRTLAPEATAEESSDRDGAAGAAAAVTVTVVVLGGTHDAGVGGLRLASRGMRIVGVRGAEGRRLWLLKALWLQCCCWRRH